MNRRAVLAGAGALGVALCGCISTSPTPPGGVGAGGNESSDDGGEGPRRAVELGGSSTVYPITNEAGKYWQANASPTNKKLWGPAQYGIKTQENMADYWAGLYGFSPTDGGSPPFASRVLLSHSGTGLEKLMNQQVDIGDSSAPVKAELPERNRYKKFKDHVVGVDGQPIVVSKPISDAGVKKLTGKELKAIYKGEITKWQQIDSYTGPNKEIQTVCRSKGSGTDTAFRNNLFGNPDAKIKCDVRKGQNQQVRQLVSQSDNAIAYMALAFVGKQVPAVALEIDGTTYKLGKNLGAKGYPLSRDLHCYTWKGTSKKEAAFLRMILSKFGQDTFVAKNNYFRLPPNRRKAQLDKLPDPTM